ncbi:MAG: heme biosynthesis HemY N-terminal domain-containing protein [Rhodovibrionaceae bacterium]
MWRAIFYFVQLALLVAVAVWLARRPGAVTIDWLGQRIETQVGILILAVLLFAGIIALLYRGWRALYRAPKAVGHRLDENRRRKGYRALTQGMVAVAAGDAEEARKQSRKADVLLGEPPLTMLLSAQAAQLNGDEAAAERYFQAMLENQETRFLGLRGLLTQARKRGDDEAALGYLRQAYKLRPNTPWVLENLSEVSERVGSYDEAEKTLREAQRHRALPKPEAEHRRAGVLLRRAAAEREQSRPDLALKDAKAALKLEPDLVPAAVMLAEMQASASDPRRALKTLEKAWAQKPDPALSEAARRLLKGEKPLDLYRRIQKLVAARPGELESALALAEAALEAKLWGEARRHLAPFTGAEAPPRRVCVLMAELEEAEHGDLGAARDWLLKGERLHILPPPAPPAAKAAARHAQEDARDAGEAKDEAAQGGSTEIALRNAAS